MSTTPEVTCDVPAERVRPEVTWSMSRKPNPEVSSEPWRTELEVCATQLQSQVRSVCVRACVCVVCVCGVCVPGAVTVSVRRGCVR